jgi:hypothetical protein
MTLKQCQGPDSMKKKLKKHLFCHPERSDRKRFLCRTEEMGAKKDIFF